MFGSFLKIYSKLLVINLKGWSSIEKKAWKYVNLPNFKFLKFHWIIFLSEVEAKKRIV